MTKKELARMCVIIHELCHLSRDGWRHAKPCDYLPLEAELRALQVKRTNREERS